MTEAEPIKSEAQQIAEHCAEFWKGGAKRVTYTQADVVRKRLGAWSIAEIQEAITWFWGTTEADKPDWRAIQERLRRTRNAQEASNDGYDGLRNHWRNVARSRGWAYPDSIAGGQHYNLQPQGVAEELVGGPTYGTAPPDMLVAWQVILQEHGHYLQLRQKRWRMRIQEKDGEVFTTETPFPQRLWREHYERVDALPTAGAACDAIKHKMLGVLRADGVLWGWLENTPEDEVPF